MIAGGHTSSITDARNWPPIYGKSLSGYQQKNSLMQLAMALMVVVDETAMGVDAE